MFLRHECSFSELNGRANKFRLYSLLYGTIGTVYCGTVSDVRGPGPRHEDGGWQKFLITEKSELWYVWYYHYCRE